MQPLNPCSASDAKKLRASSGRTATLAPNHTASGNPTRFLTGAVDIRPDAEWGARMGARERRLVTACTAPALLAYGYRLGATEIAPRRRGDAERFA